MTKPLCMVTAALACTAIFTLPGEGPTLAASDQAASTASQAWRPAGPPDPVLEWNQILNDTVLASVPAPNSLVTSRSAALVAAAVFDAVNGIERDYEPIRITARAPAFTSARAAAVQAAYAMLVLLYPPHAAVLAIRRDASIAALGSGRSAESAQAVNRGIAWGQDVAHRLWRERDGDGFTPAMAPFVGTTTIGFWRPTLPGFLPGSGPQFASMTPWVIIRPSQFRPPPPHALSSPEYAADYNETLMWGAATGSLRGPEDSAVARFWSGNGTLYWTRIAIQLAGERRSTVAENARLFAMLHLAMADASIATWDAKYRYLLWRPVTAIRSLDDDGNDGTQADPSWTPFLTTSAHPEYPSGHSNLAGVGAAVLGAAFGYDAAFEASSEIVPGPSRSFVTFADAVAEMADARVFGGMHFRTACVRGSALGAVVAEYVMRHSMRPVRDKGHDRFDERP